MMNTRMEIQEITDKTAWDRYVTQQERHFLLQAWQWGEFAQSLGRKVLRIGLMQKGELSGVSQIVKIESKRGNYLETHGAPLMDYTDWAVFDFLHHYLIKLAREEGVHFFRIRPPLIHSDDLIMKFQDLGYIKAPMYFHAEHTLYLDLTQTEEETLKRMRKNTRYYIRQAEKNAVKIEFCRDAHELDVFYDLYQDTVHRQKFVPYPQEYFQQEFAAFNEDQAVELAFAEYEGRILAAAMIIRYGDVGYYHHGASIRTEPDVYANYLLQWEIIKRLKQAGVQSYDFFGVAPTDAKDHPRAGLTTFKRGFGGERVRLMHTLDFPIRPWRYWPLYLFVKYERKQRGL